jgi:uncharacterized protein (TIGR00299 family) protein
MRLLFVDAGAGAAGDMILGALVDLGLPVARLNRTLGTMPLGGWKLRSRRVVRHGLVGRKVDVRVAERQTRRDWKAIRRIIRAGDLEPIVRDRSLEIFRRLIEAEAEVHGVPADRVHLHEAGAADAIVDVVGACYGLRYLGVERLVVSPMTTGHGTVQCQHGRYPVPAPATALLVRGFPVVAGSIEVERLTPTGAAILTTLADDWGPMPPMRPAQVAYGAGDREFDDHPNFLRMILGTADTQSAECGTTEGRTIVVLEATLDDVPPQNLAYACERLFERGALEVFTHSVSMKKGRTGHQITVLGRPDQLADLSECLLTETSSLGLRFRTEQRIEVERESRRVATRWGDVRVKSGHLGRREIRAWPEYEDCADLARRHDVPLAEVQRAALEAFRGAEKITKPTMRRLNRGRKA